MMANKPLKPVCSGAPQASAIEDRELEMWSWVPALRPGMTE